MMSVNLDLYIYTMHSHTYIYILYRLKHIYMSIYAIKGFEWLFFGIVPS